MNIFNKYGSSLVFNHRNHEKSRICLIFEKIAQQPKRNEKTAEHRLLACAERRWFLRCAAGATAQFTAHLPTSGKHVITYAVSILSDLEACVAFAFVGSHRIYAGSIIADSWRSMTFIRVDARITISCQYESSITDTLEGTLEIVADSVLTNPGPITLVNI